MFDSDDPTHLQTELEAFLERWHGHRKPWFGISPEKLTRLELPRPLSWLYGFAGSWPGLNYWDTLLGNQDCLLPFESLSTANGKLPFVQENQGVWQVATERTGEDPPVWFAEYHGSEWLLLSNSLTQFLVTFILHETVFGCRHVERKRGLKELLTETGIEMIPLWLGKPYPLSSTETATLDFFIANDSCLIMGDWCATNIEAPWERLPAVFRDSSKSDQRSSLVAYEPIPDHLEIPSFKKQAHLKNAIRLHREQVGYHHQRCKFTNI